MDQTKIVTVPLRQPCGPVKKTHHLQRQCYLFPLSTHTTRTQACFASQVFSCSKTGALAANQPLIEPERYLKHAQRVNNERPPRPCTCYSPILTTHQFLYIMQEQVHQYTRDSKFAHINPTPRNKSEVCEHVLHVLQQTVIVREGLKVGAFFGRGCALLCSR